MRVLTLALLSCISLAACQGYHAQPLPRAPVYSRLQVDRQSLGGQALPPHPIHPGQALDLSTIELLAVSHNPQLRAQASAHHLAQAQAIRAGYLPDPVYGYSHDHPQSGPDSLNAHAQTLDFDLASLLSLGLNRRHTEAQQKQIDLALLWQEWQVLALVRQQAYQLRADTELAQLEERAYRLQAQLAAHQAQALSLHAIEARSWQSSAAQAADAEQRWQEARLQVLSDRQALLASLGLAPGTPLQLAPLPAISLPATQPDLRQRPDLQALQAAWQSEDIGYRMALLRQFPALDLGLGQSTDNTGTSSLGYAVHVPLPVFNGNRPAIKVAEARRQHIGQLYAQRLTQSQSDIENLHQRIGVLQDQENRANLALQRLSAQARQAAQLLAARRLNLSSYTRLYGVILQKRIDLATLRGRREQEQLCLIALLGIVPPWEHSNHV